MRPTFDSPYLWPLKRSGLIIRATATSHTQPKTQTPDISKWVKSPSGLVDAFYVLSFLKPQVNIRTTSPVPDPLTSTRYPRFYKLQGKKIK